MYNLRCFISLCICSSSTMWKDGTSPCVSSWSLQIDCKQCRVWIEQSWPFPPDSRVKLWQTDLVHTSSDRKEVQQQTRKYNYLKIIYTNLQHQLTLTWLINDSNTLVDAERNTICVSERRWISGLFFGNLCLPGVFAERHNRKEQIRAKSS